MAENLRRIKSYVILAARMSDSQKKAYEELSPGRIVEYDKSIINWDTLLPAAEKRIVEIGFGMGDATRRMAEERPLWGILGIEVHIPGVGKLLWWMKEKNLDNIRIIEHDAVEVMEDMISSESIDGFHIWFPDPWPKKRHHKRRLIQAEFVASAVRCLRPGGYIHVATDWEPYAEHIIEILNENKLLKNRYEAWASKPDYRPDTKFENRGVAENRAIRDIIFERKTK